MPTSAVAIDDCVGQHASLEEAIPRQQRRITARSISSRDVTTYVKSPEVLISILLDAIFPVYVMLQWDALAMQNLDHGNTKRCEDDEQI